MTTRDRIVALADDLIRDRGINAFSFADISEEMGIKNASVHYYFPTKSSLCLAVIKRQQVALEEMISLAKKSAPLDRLEQYMSIYDRSKEADRVCLVGSLAPDLHTLNEDIRVALKEVAARILEWVTEILEEGRDEGVFRFGGNARSRALLIVTNMLASLQLTRLTKSEDFSIIKKSIIKDLTS
ncbi:MAG: TetR/AcrR family transcriptional regulator [Taibaiella sp.]|nr:TetR/AcrR family transcriptional regulator [Taibaiella sp.]